MASYSLIAQSCTGFLGVADPWRYRYIQSCIYSLVRPDTIIIISGAQAPRAVLELYIYARLCPNMHAQPIAIWVHGSLLCIVFAKYHSYSYKYIQSDRKDFAIAHTSAAWLYVISTIKRRRLQHNSLIATALAFISCNGSYMHNHVLARYTSMQIAIYKSELRISFIPDYTTSYHSSCKVRYVKAISYNCCCLSK